MNPIVDISYWQRPELIDYDKFANAISGAILRGAYGIWKDTAFETHYAELHKRNVPLGSYHYIIGNKTPEAQADIFNQAINGKELKLGLWDDVEDRHTTTGLYPSIVNQYHASIELLTKRKVGIYTGQYAWFEIMGKDAYKYSDRPLWMSWPMSTLPPMPIGSTWKTWLLWQYTFKGKIDGYNYDVDCNNFNGSEDEYKQHFGLGGIVVPEPPTNGVTLPKLKVLRFVNIREEPNVSSKVIGEHLAGDILDVLEIRPLSTTSVWVRDKKGWSAVIYKTNVFTPTIKYME